MAASALTSVDKPKRGPQARVVAIPSANVAKKPDMRKASLLALTMGACTPSAAQPTPTPIDAMEYLVQAPENGGRHDWPLPYGYAVGDSLRESVTIARQTWDFEPFGSFEPERGDGFQIAEVGADGFVRFTSTQDGGTPWVQHLVGQRCGGTGWLVFGVDAQSGTWRDVVAWLNIAPDPRSCPPTLNPAYTRYRLEQVTFPFAYDGVASTVTLPTIISEHYNGQAIASAVSLERFYLSKGYGLVRWEAWGPEPPKVNLSQRCVAVDYSAAPISRWLLQDCRTWTNVTRTK